MSRYVLGLTGPTGAGKGELDRLLKERGFAVIDTDALAREVVAPGSDCLRGLVKAFSPAILREDGSLDRAALAALAFASKEAQQRLNRLTHPFIIARSRGILETNASDLFVIDAPLLFESGMDALCDETLAVLCPAELRRARIMARDGLDASRADARMAAQPNDEFYRARATYCIDNGGDLAALAAELDALLKEANR